VSVTVQIVEFCGVRGIVQDSGLSLYHVQDQ
jgi:hypothetical protein